MFSIKNGKPKPYVPLGTWRRCDLPVEIERDTWLLPEYLKLTAQSIDWWNMTLGFPVLTLAWQAHVKIKPGYNTQVARVALMVRDGCIRGADMWIGNQMIVPNLHRTFTRSLGLVLGLAPDPRAGNDRLMSAHNAATGYNLTDQEREWCIEHYA